MGEKFQNVEKVHSRPRPRSPRNRPSSDRAAQVDKVGAEEHALAVEIDSFIRIHLSVKYLLMHIYATTLTDNNDLYHIISIEVNCLVYLFAIVSSPNFSYATIPTDSRFEPNSASRCLLLNQKTPDSTNRPRLIIIKNSDDGRDVLSALH